jgi:hypothetical protein
VPATGALTDLAPSQLDSLVSDSADLAQELLAGGVDDRLAAEIVFKNLSAIMADALLANDGDRFARGIEAVAQFWDLGDRTAMYSMQTPDFEVSLCAGHVGASENAEQIQRLQRARR